MTRPAAERSESKLRLLVVTALFPPAVGGASEDFRLLTEAWERSESVERVVILTERRGGTPGREVKGKTIVRRLVPATSRVKRQLGPLYVAKRLWMYALLTAMVAWHLSVHRSNVVLVHGRYGRKDFLRVLKLIGARVVVLLSDHFRPPEDLADCDAVICIAENVYESARSKLLGGCQVYYVPLPFECPQARRRIALEATSTPYFLFLGEVSQWKGADVLLEAFAAFRRDYPGYDLLLAGPICDMTLLATKCPRATFLGGVDHERALDLIQGAEALVLPSKSEGLPRVCLEAFALGTKVICPPGVPELQRACPEWVLNDITCREILGKIRQAVSFPFRSSFEFKNYNPDLAGNRILEICNAISGNRLQPRCERDEDGIVPRSTS